MPYHVPRNVHNVITSAFHSCVSWYIDGNKTCKFRSWRRDITWSFSQWYMQGILQFKQCHIT